MAAAQPKRRLRRISSSTDLPSVLPSYSVYGGSGTAASDDAAPPSHPAVLASVPAVGMGRRVDNCRCIFSKCAHGSRTINIEDNGVKVAVPSKLLKRMGKKRREALVVEWDEHADACFHEDCWDLVEQATSSRARSKKAQALKLALAEDDAKLVSEVAETAERFETIASMTQKAKEIAALLRKSKHTVVFTGAGVSAAAGIPTYRGTDGIDVIAEFGGKQDVQPEEKADLGNGADAAAADVAAQSSSKAAKKKGKGSKRKAAAEPEPEQDPSIEQSEEYLRLQPTATHMLISKWAREHLVHFVITQNCDDLHQRAGVPRTLMTELHGNVFVEYCEECFVEHRRPYCVDLFSTDCSLEKWYVTCKKCKFNHYTGRTCEQTGCRGKLKDTIVNFGDDLHETVLGGLDLAMNECQRASVTLCLGSSLTVTPASNLPTLLPRDASIIIGNLQATEHDARAAVRVWGSCDQLLQLIDTELAAQQK